MMSKKLIEKILKNPLGYIRGKRYVYSMHGEVNKIYRIEKNRFDNGYYDFWEYIGHIRNTAQGLVFIAECKE